MNKMKTLTIQGVPFEIVDEAARASIPEKIVQAVNGVEPDENGNVNIDFWRWCFRRRSDYHRQG